MNIYLGDCVRCAHLGHPTSGYMGNYTYISPHGQLNDVAPVHTPVSTPNTPTSSFNMHTFAKIAVFVVSALSLTGSAAAAPVESSGSSELVARAPYDVHSGWVSAQTVRFCPWLNTAP
jgi:hypothetical protein